MNQDFLQQFCQQLATWIEDHLATQRLPFQRLELCPSILTENGRLTPDIVLWINRDSQLAGSMILLPAVVDNDVLHEASAISKALGLGHFTTWAAREVSIWRVKETGPEIIQSFPLPPANQVKPEDFEWTLERLLEELKLVTITTAPATSEYSLFYYANLCLRTLQDMSPGLTESARLSGGQTAADEWVKQAPIEKSWMSLWRILFLLWQKRLPPGLQPNRLEQVFHYAMADYAGCDDLKSRIDLHSEEPPLADTDAVRLHHLASRMSQLGWPANAEAAATLNELLLGEIAFRYRLIPGALPWETGYSTLWVNTQVHKVAADRSIVAPRAYLAGIALTALLTDTRNLVLAENLQKLSRDENHLQAVAILIDQQIPNRNDREARLLLLRKAWPNRRFDIHHKTPAWLLDTIYIAGIVKENLSVTLPAGWHLAPAVTVLWETLKDSYQLEGLSIEKNGEQTLLLSRSRGETITTHVYRKDQDFKLRHDCLTSAPTATQFWLKADRRIIDYFQERTLGASNMQWSDAIRWGAYLFLHTQLGQYLWTLCVEKPDLPRLNQVEEAIRRYGIPIPDEIALQDLSLSGSPIDQNIPSQEVLEQDFSGIWGICPDLPTRNIQAGQQGSIKQHKGKIILDGIIKVVFIDGIPRFPEHYLMGTYKPELTRYDLDGPLEYAEEFFDKISLRSVDGSLSLEVSGKILAESLILASWSGYETVELPTDHAILEEILVKYRNDLNRLWDKLTRECRRVEPHRQSALRTAKKLWQKQGLPPGNLFS